MTDLSVSAVVTLGRASMHGLQAPEPVPFAAPDIDEADVDSVVRVLRSGWLTTGEECLNLERELADYLGARHVVALGSGTAALETAFAWLALPAGARVGVPTWTFVASALAPARHGATPVLLDVDPDTLNLSSEAVHAELDRGLDALVAVHFGGLAVDAGVREACGRAEVPVVEDAAHALGAVDERGRLAGAGSVAACFSFYATKNLTAVEGGALATESRELADFARSFRLHGLSRDAWARYRPDGAAGYDLVAPGIKANLPDVLATLARSQLRRLGAMQARRRVLVEHYRKLLFDAPGLRLVPPTHHEGSADHLMVVILPEETRRDDVVARLREEHIGSSVHFQPLHHFAWFHRHASVGATGTAVADALAPRALSLPLHSSLELDMVDRVCEVLLDCLA